MPKGRGVFYYIRIMDETHCIIVSSRGLLKSCNHYNDPSVIHSSSPVLSRNLLDNINDYDTVYICNTAIPTFVEYFLPNLTKKIILVSGDSDDPIPIAFYSNFHTLVNSPFIVHWYCQNFLINHHKVTRMPIGLDYHTPIINPMNPGFEVSPKGQEEYILNLVKESKPFYKRNRRIYTTFHFELGRGDRQVAFNQIPKELIDYEPQKIHRYFSHKKQLDYTFVASPYGAGIDCHRTWESLVLGCIPIIKKNSGIDPLFNDLPVLLVNKWSDVNQKLLDKTIDEFKIRFGDNPLHKKLTLQYWVNLFNSHNLKNNCLDLYNSWGIGDSVFNLMFFRHISEYLKINNIFINYYLKKEYIDQPANLKEYTESLNVILKPLDELPSHAIDLWIANDRIYKYKTNPNEWEYGFDTYYINFYNAFMTKINIPIQLNTHYLEDETLNPLYNKLPEVYKNIDILFINSIPISDCGYTPHLAKWPPVIKMLSKKYKIVTTYKVEGLPCTLDDGLSIKQIGAISTHAKYIVSTHTGPFSACHNSYAKSSVKKWFILTSFAHTKYTELTNTYSYENIEDILSHFL